jgi:hypothetical protein
MDLKEKGKLKKPYMYVKDSDGVVYICKSEDLKNAEELTEEELKSCMIPPGDA